MIQGLMARYLDKDRYDVHIAVNPGPNDHGTSAWDSLSDIPGVSLVKTNFGPSLHSGSKAGTARNVVRGTGALMSLPKLAAYAKQHGIRIVHGIEKRAIPSSGPVLPG